jgi:UTP--glucose-1-phosphate uridylyltransferase
VVPRLVAAFSEDRAACALAVEEVPAQDTSRYGIVAPDGDAPSGEAFSVADLIEKPPAGEAPSNVAIAARYVFASRIFAALRATPPGAGGELQLTDAIRRLLAEGGRVVAVRTRAPRFDVGTPEGYRAAAAALDAQRAG